MSLRVALPGGDGMHKGRLLALRYDPRRASRSSAS